MRRKTINLVLAGCLLVNAGSTFAADYQFLSDPSLIGLGPGFDGLWDTADDGGFPGLNPLGGASGFSDNIGNFGFATGTITTNASGPATFGVNTLTATATTGEFSNPGFGIFNSPFTQTFDPGTSNTVTIFADHTQVASYGVDQVDAFGGAKISVTGSYFWILPGENPVDVFPLATADDIAHFNFLIGLLPVDWTILISGVEFYEFTTGVGAGALGGFSKTIFSTDPGAVAFVPIPGDPSAILACAGRALAHEKKSRGITRWI